jgi:hypothetical protein
MKQIRISFIVLLVVLLVSACNVTAAEVNARVPIAMPATGTSSPRPTQTLTPASPTPSRLEFPIQDASLEIQIMDIERPHQVYLSDNQIFTTGEGNLFLGLGIRVTNLTDSDIEFNWSDIYLTNKYEDKWYPIWGAYKKTNLMVDPLGIQIHQFKVDSKDRPDAHIYLGDNGYLRVIFRLPRDNHYYYLSFADLPLLEIANDDF